MSTVENVEAPAPRVGAFLIMCNSTELKVFHRLMHISQEVLTKLNPFDILTTSIKQEGEHNMNSVKGLNNEAGKRVILDA